jgi:hypothetical protein
LWQHCNHTLHLKNTIIFNDFQINTASYISVCIDNKLSILKQMRCICCKIITQYAVVYVISSTKPFLHTQQLNSQANCSKINYKIVLFCLFVGLFPQKIYNTRQFLITGSYHFYATCKTFSMQFPVNCVLPDTTRDLDSCSLSAITWYHNHSLRNWSCV